MEDVTKGLSPAVYVLALICFFLPFVTFSCQGQKIVTLSGIQLVTGTTINQPQPFGPPKSQKVDAEPLAVLAFLSGIAGLALSFLRGRKSAIAPATAGVVAAILLLALKSKLDGDALRQGGGVIQVDYAAGFWAVLILFLAAVAVNVFFLVQGKGLPPPTPKASGDKFCAQCGSRNLSTDVFCRECGAGLVPVAPEAPSAALMATKLTRCPACGADLEPGKKFCGKCGAKLELAHAAPPSAAGVTWTEKKAPAPEAAVVSTERKAVDASEVARPTAAPTTQPAPPPPRSVAPQRVLEQSAAVSQPRGPSARYLLGAAALVVVGVAVALTVLHTRKHEKKPIITAENAASLRSKVLARVRGNAYDIDSTADGHTISVLAIGVDLGVILFDTETGAQVARCPANFGSYAISGSGRVIAQTVRSGEILLCDPLSPSPLGSLRPGPVGFTSVALSPNGRLLASGRADGVVQLWDVTTRELLWTSDPPSPPMQALKVAVTDDRQVVALYLIPLRHVRYWNASVGTFRGFELRTTGDTNQYIRMLSFVTADRVLVSFGGTSWLVNVSSEKGDIRFFPRRADALAPDGRTVVSVGDYVGGGGQGYTPLTIWDLNTGDEIATLNTPRGMLAVSATFTRNGTALLASTNGGEILVWPLQPAPSQPSARESPPPQVQPGSTPSDRAEAPEAGPLPAASATAQPVILSKNILLSRGFGFDDQPRAMCSIKGPDGRCQVEAFVFGELRQDPAAYTCSKLDRASYVGHCVDGALQGISVVIADGTTKVGRQALVSYFCMGRMAYPALTSYLDGNQSNFGVREKSMSYGCVYFGKWDNASTRNSCPRFMDIYGSDIFTESNAQGLREGTFNLSHYGAKFIEYAQGK